MEIHVYGMVRSGNHAIINWIGLNYNKSAIHYNNIYVQDNQLCSHFYKDMPTAIATYHYGSYKYRAMSGKDKAYYCVTLQQHFDLTIISHENVPLNILPNIQSTDFLIVRDPYNWLASIFAHGTIAKSLGYSLDLNDALRLLIQAYIDNFSCNITIINFNKWFSDSTYRIQLAERLQLPIHHRGIEHIAEHGWGSSFEDLQLQNRASQMRVLERWKYYADDEDFKNIFQQYPQLVDINNRYFQND